MEIYEETDAFEKNKQVGRLSKKAIAELSKIEKKHNCNIEIALYAGAPNRNATLVKVFKKDDDSDYVGLVGSQTCQFYDDCPETEKICQEIALKIYEYNAIFKKEAEHENIKNT